MDVVNNFIRLRNKTTDAKESGLTVALLPDGLSAPGGLISLTQDTGINWQYNFPGGVVNGLYTLYVGGVVAQSAGVDIEVYVIRDGIITEAEAAFLKDTW